MRKQMLDGMRALLRDIDGYCDEYQSNLLQQAD